ncbi:PadR family transcriptional regulator [Ectobacillus polymachus]|uniref:PadR family transcriptional regulator n=1 Tax=Ectobacillus polymachus TaxID=1508806 RepID=UPI003A845F4B
MENLSEMLKGILEGIILEIIGRGEVYGYEIMKKLQQLGFDGIAEGTVYTILVRLERGKMVHITKKPSDIGPPRKFYSLNEVGMEELAKFWEKWKFINERIQLLKNGGHES